MKLRRISVGVLILILAVGIAAAATLGSIHTTDTDFQDATLTNMSITGTGESASVELDMGPGDSYGVVEDSGDGSTDGTDTFVGDLTDDTRVNSSAKTVPDFTGTVSTIKVNIGATVGADYGFVVDVYAIQEEPDGTYGEGTLVADNWDPDFATGNQTIPLDTTFAVTSGQTWTIEFVTQSTDGDSTSDRININYDSSFTSTWYTTRGFTRDRGAQIYLETAPPPADAEYLHNHSVTSTIEGFTNITTADNVTITVTWKGDSNGDGSYDTTLNQTTGITSAANHTFTWSEFSGGDVRVNVTVASAGTSEAFTLADEGVNIADATPTATATAVPAEGVQGGNPLFDVFVSAEDLHSDFVSIESVTTAFALVVVVLLFLFLWLGYRLRSPLLGTLWLFMLLSFVFALLFDTPLEWFWMATMLTGIGAVAALVNTGGR